MLGFLSIRIPLLLSVALLASTLTVNPSVALAQDPVPPSGSFDEKEAQGIDRMLMCPVCPAESIDQAQVELARQMRQQVRLMLSQGKSREEVLDYFVQRYGQHVLAAPPFGGVSLLAWVIPIGSVLLGITAGFVILRSMTRRTVESPDATPTEERELEPYLEAIDRGLGFETTEQDIVGTPPGGTRDRSATEERNG